MADIVKLFESASLAAHWYAAAEQPDGAVVADALPNAASVSVTRRFQGVVL